MPVKRSFSRPMVGCPESVVVIEDGNSAPNLFLSAQSWRPVSSRLKWTSKGIPVPSRHKWLEKSLISWRRSLTISRSVFIPTTVSKLGWLNNTCRNASSGTIWASSYRGNEQISRTSSGFPSQKSQFESPPWSLLDCWTVEIAVHPFQLDVGFSRSP
jgi:hypothetical protein